MSGEVTDPGVGDELALGQGQVAQGGAQPAQLRQAQVRQLQQEQRWTSFKTHVSIENTALLGVAAIFFFLGLCH